MTAAKRLSLVHRTGFALLHLGFVWALTVRPNSMVLAVALAFYLIRILGITAGFHRLFTHKSYQAHPVLEFVLALFGTLAGQGPLTRWVAHHLKHHKFSDQKGDLHSPVVESFYFSHMGWLFIEQTFVADKAQERLAKTWSRPVQWLDRNFTLIFIAQAVLLGFLGGKEYLAWVFFVSLVLALHSTFLVNSLSHIWGKRLFNTADDSRNNALVAILTLGEGWHNNHHAHPRNVRHGLLPLQFDATYLFVRAMAALGLATKLQDHDLKGLLHESSTAKSQ
jgi:stearoyl-CoA desaturase (delta-9 desaturase)